MQQPMREYIRSVLCKTRIIVTECFRKQYSDFHSESFAYLIGLEMFIRIYSALFLISNLIAVNAQCTIELSNSVFFPNPIGANRDLTFSFVYLLLYIPTAQCYTPEGISGQCISVYSCQNVLLLLQGPSTSLIASYLRSLQCVSNVGRFPHVCCVVPNSPRPQPTTSPKLTTVNRISSGTGNILTSTCAVTTSEDILGDRIIGGIDAQLNDYPWTVLLEYQTR